MPLLLLISLSFLVLKIYYIGRIFIIEDEAYYWFWSKNISWGYPEHPPMIAWIIATFKNLIPSSDNTFFNFWDVRISGLVLSLILFFIAYDWGAHLENSENIKKNKSSNHKKKQLKKFQLLKIFPSSSTGIVFASLTVGIPYYFGSFFLITPDTPLVFTVFLTLYFYFRGIFEKPIFFLGGGIFLGLGMLSKLTILLPAIGLLIFFLTSKLTRHRFFNLFFFRDRENIRYLFYLFLSILLAFLIFLPYVLWNIKYDLPVLHNLERLIYQDASLSSFFRFWGEQALLYFPFIFPFLLILPFAVVIPIVYRYLTPIENPCSIQENKKYFLALMSLIPLLYFFYKSTNSSLRINWLGGGLVGSTALFALWITENPLRMRKLLPVFITMILVIGLLLSMVFYIISNKFIPLNSVEDKLKKVYPKYKIFFDSYLTYDFFQNRFRDYYQEKMRKELPIVSANYQLPSLINYYVHPDTEAFGYASRESYHLMIFYFLPHKNYSKKLKNPYYLLLNHGDSPNEKLLRWSKYNLTPHKLKTFFVRSPINNSNNQGRAYDLYLLDKNYID